MKINHPMIFSVQIFKKFKRTFETQIYKFSFSFPAFSPQPNRILLTNKKQLKKKKKKNKT